MDVAVSYHHWMKISYFIKRPNESLEETLDQFMNDEILNGPFIDHHLLYWAMEKQGYPNILYLSYEDMKNDLGAVIEKTQRFLGKSYTKEQLEQLKDHLSFDKMKSKIKIWFQI
jgi:hypothetical protein